MVWSSSTTRHVGWLRSVLILWPDGLNASNPFLPDPLASPPDGSPSRFRIIAASPSSGSLGRISLKRRVSHTQRPCGASHLNPPLYFMIFADHPSKKLDRLVCLY